MDLITRLQELDSLIVENTKPPVTSKLRNKLALAIEEAEAYQAAADKQDHTLAVQAETIEKLQAENTQRYERDPQWPGTMVSKSGERICEHCFKTKKADLLLIWDGVNKLWTCAGCGAHLNKPPNA